MHSQTPANVVHKLVSRAKGFMKSQTSPRLSKSKGSELEVDRTFCPDIPQAGVIEENLEEYAVRDWRKQFASRLNGLGIEIGPLHRPLETHPGMTMHYVDHHSVEELRRVYPELRELPLVEPHILSDAQTLANVPSGTYDFIVAAHVIEHMRNPLLAVESWLRVLKSGGLLYLIVPDKRATFDIQRVRTTLGHLILDYIRPSKERDYEHYLDYAIHVQKAEWHTTIPEADRLNDIDYSIHFHVFMPTDVVNMLTWFNENIQPIEIVDGPSMSPGSDEFHILVRALEKPAN